jgi:predicted AlkP superfamily phosphohydrolase/phosphomutase
MCTEIMDRLRDLRDESGERVIAAVYRREEVYHGDQVDLAPDIVFQFREDRLYTAYASRFTERVLYSVDFKQADHSMDGIFVACGSGIAGQAGHPLFNIWDVLPTAMYLNGRRIPRICDGRVLTEIFDEPPSEVEFDEDWRRYLPQLESVAYGKTEIEEINERLKALGYLDD